MAEEVSGREGRMDGEMFVNKIDLSQAKSDLPYTPFTTKKSKSIIY